MISSRVTATGPVDESTFHSPSLENMMDGGDNLQKVWSLIISPNLVHIALNSIPVSIISSTEAV